MIPPEVLEKKWEKFQANRNDDALLRILAGEYLHLVNTVVYGLSPAIRHYTPMEDLRSVGTLGLLKAIAHYKSGEKSFTPFALRYIKYEILNDLRERDPLSRTERARLRKIITAQNEYTRTHGVLPRPDELEMLTGFSAQQIAISLSIHREFSCTISLDDAQIDDTKFIDEHEPSPDEQTHYKLANEILQQAIQTLSTVEICIIEDRENNVSIKKTADKLGISEGRVSQYYGQIIQKLKKILNPDQEHV